MAKLPKYLRDAVIIVSICEQLAQKLEARADEAAKWLRDNPGYPDMHDATVRIHTLREAAIFIRDQYNQLEEPCTSHPS